MEFTIFVNMSEQEVARLIELLILVAGMLTALMLLIRPLVLRYVHGAPRPLPGKPPKPTVEDEEGAGAGLVKVSVWVPEQNAGHVQLLAKELRKTGVPKPDAKPEPKNGGQRPG